MISQKDRGQPTLILQKQILLFAIYLGQDLFAIIELIQIFLDTAISEME